MKKISETTEAYQWDEDYRLDIVISEDMYDAWIYGTDIGFKLHMFGVSKGNNTLDDFREIVFRNIQTYIQTYEETNDALESQNI